MRDVRVVVPTTRRSAIGTARVAPWTAPGLREPDPTALDFVRMRTADAGFDHEKFQDYVVKCAFAQGIEGRAALATTSGINRSSLSKWYTGEEQPSIVSLKKLASVIRAPINDLLVLAGHMAADELGKLPVPPSPPKVRPVVSNLAKVLAEDSPLSQATKDQIETLVGLVVDPALREMRSLARTTGARRKAV